MSNPIAQASVADFPKIWFEDNSQYGKQDIIVPYLVPPLQPSPGMYMLNGLQYGERRFITSSGIKDAITGSKPVRYIRVSLTSTDYILNIVLRKGYDNVFME